MAEHSGPHAEWKRQLSLLSSAQSRYYHCYKDDPIYLLRLMLISKCPLRKLTAQTVQSLWGKFLQIYSHRFIDVLTVGVLSEANELGLLTRCLSLEELEAALVSLYELSGVSKGRLSYSAASLYNAIERSLHPS